MAKIIYEHPVKEIRGAIARKGVIYRTKVYRNADGSVLREGKPEAYHVRNPRDYKKNPPRGEELKHQLRWKQACEQTYNDLHDPTKRQEWQARFIAQLKRKTPDTPIDPKTGKPKHYARFDAFVRATIYARLKAMNP